MVIDNLSPLVVGVLLARCSYYEQFRDATHMDNTTRYRSTGLMFNVLG